MVGKSQNKGWCKSKEKENVKKEENDVMAVAGINLRPIMLFVWIRIQNNNPIGYKNQDSRILCCKTDFQMNIRSSDN